MADPSGGEVTLEQLRDYAASNPDEPFQVNSHDKCLAARFRGARVSSHHRYFDDVPIATEYGDLTYRATVVHGRWCWFNGSTLAAAIDRLIAGEKPEDVADSLEPLATIPYNDTLVT